MLLQSFILSALLYTTSASVLVKPVPAKNLGRIINGEEARDGQFPWQVAILGRSSIYPRYWCGGSLISEEWILTAGHCVEGFISATIYSGTSVLSSPNVTISTATEFVLHEDFDGLYLTNDIGLIKLRSPLKFNNNTQAVALPDEDIDDDIFVTVSGWGQISDDDARPNSDVLNYIEVSTINNMVCEMYFGSLVVYPGLVCTATNAGLLKSPCLGDSGSPVVSNVGRDPVQVAIFSFVNGFSCELPYPAGNTRVAYFRDWIREKTGI